MSLPLLMVLLVVAAILGDALNYSIGHWFGDALIKRTRLISAEKLKYTEQFFEKHGPKTIVIARFLPIVRTMAPFVAGFGGMKPQRFFFYNVTGVCSGWCRLPWPVISSATFRLSRII